MECKHCEKVLKSPNGTTTTLWSHVKSKHPDVLQFSNEQKISKKHSRRSLVWEHFNRLPHSFDRVKCNYCGAELSNPGGTTNMMSHLLRKHPNVKEVLITKQTEKYCSSAIIAPDEPSKDGIANSDGQTLSQGDVETNNGDVKVNENSNFDALSVSGSVDLEKDTSKYTMYDILKTEDNKEHPGMLQSQSNEEKNNIERPYSRSLVWDHFASKPDTNEKVECNNCGALISNQSGNASGMISHLTRKHPHLKELIVDVSRNKEQSMYDINNGKDMDDFYHGDARIQNIVKKSDSPIQMKEEKTFKKSRIWNHFERKNDTENEVKCKFCEKVMKSKNGTTTTLWCHLKSKHPNLPELEFPSNFTEKRTCEYCKKIFSYQHSLLIHIQAVHLKLMDFTCEICGIAFSRNGSLKKHMYTHAEEMPFKCSHCDKKFKRKHEKNVHEKTHIGVFDYSCNYCPKYFLNKEWKISHERTHTGEKPFTCEECGNTFTQRSHLVTHVRIHTEEKPYDCQNCGCKFRHLSSYKDHRCTSPC